MRNENKSEFNLFMVERYDRYVDGLKEMYRDNYEGYQYMYMSYTEWFDSLSYEEICDYVDLFKSEAHTPEQSYLLATSGC